MTLTGQGTLLASWRALARTSPRARMVRTATTLAAVFPAWTPLNNAVFLGEPSPLSAAVTAVELKRLYASAGVEAWALWLPATSTSLDAPDDIRSVAGMRRDDSTLVMALALAADWPEVDGLIRTSISAAARAGDEPVAVADLPAPDEGTALSAWAMVQDGRAVAGAWSLIDGADCGIYAVGTAEQWRRQGLARGLMEGVLRDAYRRGARTATLQSTPMGEPLYRSLGFEPVGRYDEWVPVSA